MKVVLIALALIAVPVLLAAPAAAEDPIGDPWTCIPEYPCCDTIVCLPPQVKPCRVGQYYIC